MAEIQPFRAYRYNTNRVALADVLTQPYDKITPAMQERYYAASPYNLIAVEKGRVAPDDTPENSVYTRAARKIDEWIAEKILVQDAAPAIYVYSQEFEVPGTHTRRVRIGFIALARVEDYDAHVIFRHERTLSAPKADRIELLRNTRAQTGQLFLLYDDPARHIDTWLEQTARTAPPIELRDEFGVTHRLWPASDPAFAARIQKAMADKKLVIADGHHRYETALNYRNECRARAGKTDPLAASEFAMATFINTHSHGLTILATHRLVSHLANFDFDRFRKNLTPHFDWYSYPFANPEERAIAYAEFHKDFESPKLGRRVIGVYPGAIHAGAGAFYLFALKREADLESLLKDFSEAQRGLDVVLLHRLILEKGLGITAEAVAGEKNLSYEREMDAAIAAVDRGEAQLAFLLNPVRVEQVTKIALGGDVLPQKSTDFYPKLLSGVAIYRVEGRIP
ncbi:MAG TPA: DUF1015 domain-containing protein [Candidatus Acidoferrales bacterium]|nr:DUF1015 domain-containing protein [Candidatus Acidoferrales bacterium]